jgi:hypothetical protein
MKSRFIAASMLALARSAGLGSTAVSAVARRAAQATQYDF